MRALLPLVVLALAVPAAAVPDDPLLTGQPGSATFAGVAPLAPWTDAIDLLHVWVEEKDDMFVVVFHVTDLSAVEHTDVGVFPATTFGLRFALDHPDGEDRAARPGEWRVRGDYQPISLARWSFHVEAPCMTYHADGSCPGSDRDIIRDGISGEADFDASTVTVFVPMDLLEHPDAGARLHDPRAAAHMAWPSWPVYSSDWILDQRHREHRFQGDAEQGHDDEGTAAAPASGGLAVPAPGGILALLGAAGWLLHRRRQAPPAACGRLGRRAGGPVPRSGPPPHP